MKEESERERDDAQSVTYAIRGDDDGEDEGRNGTGRRLRERAGEGEEKRRGGGEEEKRRGGGRGRGGRVD